MKSKLYLIFPVQFPSPSHPTSLSPLFSASPTLKLHPVEEGAADENNDEMKDSVKAPAGLPNLLTAEEE